MGWNTPLTAVATVRLTAAQWNASVRDNLNYLKAGQLFISKTSDESLVSSTTLQDDDELTLQVVANTVYEVSFMLIYEAGTTGDFKYQWVAPASATFLHADNRLNVAATLTGDDTVSADDITVAITAGGLGTGVSLPIEGKGLLRVAGTAGTFKLRWAQGTSSAGATIVKADSFVTLRRVQ
jgi:hypothetical protein